MPTWYKQIPVEWWRLLWWSWKEGIRLIISLHHFLLLVSTYTSLHLVDLLHWLILSEELTSSPGISLQADPVRGGAVSIGFCIWSRAFYAGSQGKKSLASFYKIPCTLENFQKILLHPWPLPPYYAPTVQNKMLTYIDSVAWR